MKPVTDMIEGPEAFKRFQTAVKAVLTVPRSLLKKQVEEHRKQAQANPNKRGPKRKHS